MELEQGPLVSDALSDVRRKVANDAPLLMVSPLLHAVGGSTQLLPFFACVRARVANYIESIRELSLSERQNAHTP